MLVYDTRRDNLRRLIRQWGGPASLSRKLGHSNGSYLAQLAGPRPTRDVSEKGAREIEAKLGLPMGWMDTEHGEEAGAISDAALADCVRAVATVNRDMGLRPSPEVFATLTQLAYDRLKLTGRVDEQFIKTLVGLVKK